MRRRWLRWRTTGRRFVGAFLRLRCRRRGRRIWILRGRCLRYLEIGSQYEMNLVGERESGRRTSYLCTVHGRHGRVGHRQSGAGGLVHRGLVSPLNYLHDCLMCWGTYHILAINPQLLEGRMASCPLSSDQGREARQNSGLHRSK